MKKLILSLLIIVTGFFFLPSMDTAIMSGFSSGSDLVLSPALALPEVVRTAEFLGLSLMVFGIFSLSRRLRKPEGVFAGIKHIKETVKSMVAKFEVGWRYSATS